MANKKFIRLESGQFVEDQAISTSAGAGDAGKVPALDEAGLINQDMMPLGVGPESKGFVTSEALGDNVLVNVHDDAGTPKIRLATSAKGATGPYRAHGYVKTGGDLAATVLVYFESNMVGAGMAPGAEQYLGVDGVLTETPTVNIGDIVQEVGIAISATEMTFEAQQPVTVV